MSAIHYAIMNPNGNLTALVTSEVPEEERADVTAAMLKHSEQVGYLGAPRQTGNRARLRMMGEEFCGNAAMAAAAWLCREDGMKIGQEAHLLLEVSGTEDATDCRIRMLEDDLWEGTVAMPRVLKAEETEIEGERIFVVRMEGITHLIREGSQMEKARAESLLKRVSDEMSDPAVGLLQWDAEKEYMVPLVWVRDSGTMVWESGCGSGSTAIGVWLAIQRGDGKSETAVKQPGGCIRVRTEIREGKVKAVFISGMVTMEKKGILLS